MSAVQSRDRVLLLGGTQPRVTTPSTPTLPHTVRNEVPRVVHALCLCVPSAEPLLVPGRWAEAGLCPRLQRVTGSKWRLIPGL